VSIEVRTLLLERTVVGGVTLQISVGAGSGRGCIVFGTAEGPLIMQGPENGLLNAPNVFYGKKMATTPVEMNNAGVRRVEYG
jgi:hypothetical protein